VTTLDTTQHRAAGTVAQLECRDDDLPATTDLLEGRINLRT
jgi:hypothetical protein